MLHTGFIALVVSVAFTLTSYNSMLFHHYVHILNVHDMPYLYIHTEV